MITPTMSHAIQQDENCIVLPDRSSLNSNPQDASSASSSPTTGKNNNDPTNDYNNSDESKMEQGQSPVQIQPQHLLPHHLRSNCLPKPGASSLKRSRYTQQKQPQDDDSHHDNNDEERKEQQPPRQSQSQTVRFFDQIEEQIINSATGKTIKIKWPSIVTEVRTRPQTLLLEKGVLFYNAEEIATFRSEYRSIVVAHRRAKMAKKQQQQQCRGERKGQIDTFYQYSPTSSSSIPSSDSIISSGFWSITSTMSTLAGAVKGVAKDVAYALAIPDVVNSSSTSGSGGIHHHPHMSMIDSMYIFS